MPTLCCLPHDVVSAELFGDFVGGGWRMASGRAGDAMVDSTIDTLSIKTFTKPLHSVPHYLHIVLRKVLTKAIY